MKPAVLAQRLAPLTSILRCPRCAAAFSVNDQSLICENRHCFDLSRRGYVNLAPSHDQAAEKYDAELFSSRRLVFERGFYLPVAEAIARHLPDAPLTVLDAGCGEGYYTRLLAERFPQAQWIGLDISRDAITAAARDPGRACWLVADLKHLPVADASADVVLDVLTPADYAEFGRVLKPGGLLVKAVPGADYLCEIRRCVAPWLRSGDTYDNARVIGHLKQHADPVQEDEVRVTRPLLPDEARAFLRMTPMTFSVPDEVLDTLSLSEITIHMHILVCRIKEAVK
ncbi:MAG: methyltransferase domain-containing protein [Clostridia bacterium]|nr:methyltransferase domain-containing protein [Clostridia bacterium]